MNKKSSLEEKYKNNYKIIYKITYPNGKIYIGQDFTNNYNYFGSIDEELLKRDFSDDDILSFTIIKEVIFREKNITKKSLNLLEKNYILQYNSNNPNVGYNKLPVYSSCKKIDSK
ncbi:GIY-YIG nuclease family protein [Pigmentibacter ruber]|nr:GIY-YIG nuclease family protein [Pigmentibacter ruber]